MSLKRILFIALCALLVIILILTVVAVVKIVGLFSAPDATQPSETNPSTSQTTPTGSQPTTPSTEATSPSSQPTVPPTSQPTVPPTSQPTAPTQPGHVHEFELVDSKAATCTESGWRDLRCACGEAKWEPLEKQPHTFGYGQIIPATCEEGGCTRFTCSVCGAVEDRDPTQPRGHSYDNGKYFPETCTEGDYMVKTCTNQGCPEPEKKEAGSHAALGHKFGSWNEIAAGIYEQTCGRCKVSHTTEDLRVQDDQFTEKLDQNNKPYKIREIWVGTELVRHVYRYVIMDAVSQGYLENSYDYETGLTIAFKGIDGKRHKVVLSNQGDQATLTLEEEPPATQPTTPATQPTTGATQPTTPATQPTTGATQPSTGATQPTTGATQPTESNTYKLSSEDMTIKVDGYWWLKLQDSNNNTIEGITWIADHDGYVKIEGNKLTGIKITNDLPNQHITISCTYEGETYSCIVRVSA